MIFEKLYLEITRNCTLECEHCLRGNRENKNMNRETLNNIFQNIKEIDCLLLSGGEPLLNRVALEQISKLIQKYHIKVHKIGIITNGTVCSQEHIIALKELQKSCEKFEFILSSDLFHRLEWDRLSLTEKVNQNYEIYNRLFDMHKYLEDDRFKKVILNNKGRAVYLTQERLEELYHRNYIEYKMEEEKEEDISQIDNYIFGKIYIDVNGYIGKYSISFQEEDESSKEDFNVNNNSLEEIIPKYIKNREDNKKLLIYKKKL